jgi:GR25 family glycosyltransferase involved in LPS biosynthesis
LDRKEHILEEIGKMGVSQDKVFRVPGVINKEQPALGCSQAHVNALIMSKENNHSNILILEDDFTFVDVIETKKNLVLFEKLHIEWDMLLISANIIKQTDTNIECIKRVVDGQTTGGYIVNENYRETLLSNFKEGIEKFKKSKNGPVHAIDIYWKLLQPDDNWFTFYPMNAYQMESYSDIMKSVRNYKEILKS